MAPPAGEKEPWREGRQAAILRAGSGAAFPTVPQNSWFTVETAFGSSGGLLRLREPSLLPLN